MSRDQEPVAVLADPGLYRLLQRVLSESAFEKSVYMVAWHIPRVAALVASDCLRPQLVPVGFEPVSVDGLVNVDDQGAPLARGVVQESVDWIDGRAEDTAARMGLKASGVGLAHVILDSGHEPLERILVSPGFR